MKQDETTKLKPYEKYLTADDKKALAKKFKCSPSNVRQKINDQRGKSEEFILAVLAIVEPRMKKARIIAKKQKSLNQ